LKPAIVLVSLSRDSRGSASALPGESRLNEAVPKITDFGLAKRLDDDSGQTRTGAIMGTPSYMAPEQAAGLTRHIGPPADIYALGVILYEALTGRPPFRGATVYDTLEQVRSQEPVPPSQLLPGVPRDLETVCLKCLHKEPPRRYASAADLAADLDRFLEDRPVRARRTPAWERALKWAKRRPALAAVGAVSVLATVLLVAVLLSSNASLKAKEAQLTQERDQKEEESRRAKDKGEEARLKGRLAQDRSVRLAVGNGARLLQDGDLMGALPWFVAAWREDTQVRSAGESDPTDAGAAQREQTHRARISAVLRRCPRLVHFWTVGGGLRSVAFSPDGDLVMTATVNELIVRDAATGRPIGSPLHLGEAIYTASFFPTDRRLAIATSARPVGKASTVHIWDPETQKSTLTIRVESGEVQWALPSPDGRRLLIVTQAQDPGAATGLVSEARVWDTATGQPLSAALKYPSELRHAEFSPDSRRVLTATSHGIWVWDAASGRLVFPPLRHPAAPLLPQGEAVLHAVFSPDGRLIASGGGGGTAFVWDAATGQLAHSPMTQSTSVRQVAFRSDSRFLLTAGGGDGAGEAREWDLATGRPFSEPWRMTGAVRRIVYNPNGDDVLTATDEGVVQVWDPGLTEPVIPPLRLQTGVQDARFSPDGRFLLVAGHDDTVRVWDLVPPTAAPTPFGGAYGPPDAWVEGGWHARDGRLLIASFVPGERNRKGYLRLWDVATGRPLSPPIAWGYTIEDAAFSADGRRLITADSSGKVGFWDGSNGRLLAELPGERSWARGVGFTPDGRAITIRGDGQEERWDADTGRRLATGPRYGSSVTRAAFSADGRRVVTVDQDPRTGQVAVHTWDAASGEPAGPALRAEIRDVPSTNKCQAALSADGSRLLTWMSTETEGSARLWDVATGRPITPPLKHRIRLQSARLSLDGRLLLTIDRRFNIRTWDTATGEPITSLLPAPGVLIDVDCSADGRQLWAVTVLSRSPAEISRWDLTPLDLPAEDVERWAQVLSGERVEDGGTVSPTPDELRDTWETLIARHPELRSPSTADLLAWRRKKAEACERAGQWAVALRHLAPLLAADPNNVNLVSRRSTIYGKLLRWDEALRDASREVELSPTQWHGWNNRGYIQASLGRWREAAADYARATELAPDRSGLWHGRLLAQEAAGDPAGCRASCAALLARFAKTDKPEVAYGVVWSCGLIPGSVADPAALLALAGKAEQLPPFRYKGSFAQGIALYRAGRYEEADRCLRASLEAHGQGGILTQWFFLAMVSQRLGRADEAKKWFDRGTSAAGALTPQTPWVERQEARLLRREAEALLGGGQ
jgi:WD40 repeat protein/Flp pilus assembly protein TadD